MLESGQLCAMALLIHTLLIDDIYYDSVSSLTVLFGACLEAKNVFRKTFLFLLVC